MSVFSALFVFNLDGHVSHVLQEEIDSAKEKLDLKASWASVIQILNNKNGSTHNPVNCLQSVTLYSIRDCKLGLCDAFMVFHYV